MKTRADSWTTEEDMFLAETVLEYIRNGIPQLKAFEKVGDDFNRTTAAVGFRWNANVRHQFKKQIDDAKKQKIQLVKSQKTNKKNDKNGMKESSVVVSLPKTKNKDIPKNTPINGQNDMLDVLGKIQHVMNKMSNMEKELKNYQSENKSLKKENQLLVQNMEKLKQDFKTMEAEYETLLSIMNRARKMVLLADEDENTNYSSYKMNHDGDLKQAAN